MLAVAQHESPLRVGERGVLYVGSTRVTIDSVVCAFKEGATAEQIAQQYPSIALADIYAAISYYLRETDQVEQYLAERAEQRDRVRQQNEARFDPSGIRDRLVARKVRQPVLRLAADENLNNNLIRALRRRRPGLDIVRIQDVGLSGAPDEEVLEWAAAE